MYWQTMTYSVNMFWQQKVYFKTKNVAICQYTLTIQQYVLAANTYWETKRQSGNVYLISINTIFQYVLTGCQYSAGDNMYW